MVKSLRKHFLNELTYPIGWLLKHFMKGEVVRKPAGLLGIEPGNSRIQDRDASQRETEDAMDKTSLLIVLTQQHFC